MIAGGAGWRQWVVHQDDTGLGGGGVSVWGKEEGGRRSGRRTVGHEAEGCDGEEGLCGAEEKRGVHGCDCDCVFLFTCVCVCVCCEQWDVDRDGETRR